MLNHDILVPGCVLRAAEEGKIRIVSTREAEGGARKSETVSYEIKCSVCRQNVKASDVLLVGVVQFSRESDSNGVCDFEGDVAFVPINDAKDYPKDPWEFIL